MEVLKLQDKVLREKSLSSDASKLASLHNSLKFWKENNAAIENFLSFAAFASTISKSDYTKFVYIDEVIDENIITIQSPSLASSLPIDLGNTSNIEDRFKRLKKELTYLRESLNEVIPRIFGMRDYPIDIHKMIPTATSRGPKFIFKVINAIAPDIRRVNQLMDSDNIDLVLSAIIDTRSHINIINEEKLDSKINGVLVTDMYDELSVNDEIYLSRLYETIKQLLDRKYYSIPLREGEPERLPMRLFVNNIDVVYDIKVNVVNKLSQIIDANKSYFRVNPNYINIDFRKYFTELSEMFFADDELCSDWLLQVENMVKDMDNKIYELRNRLIGMTPLERGNYEYAKLEHFDLIDFSYSNKARFHPFIVEANLLRRCKLVYERILYYKRPLMELIISYDRLVMKRMKKAEYLESMRAQLISGVLLTEKEFSNLNINDLYNEAARDEDILFPIMAPVSSIPALVSDFFKLRKKVKETAQGTPKHKALAYAVYRLMKQSKTYNHEQKRFVEPQLSEVNAVNKNPIIESFLDSAEPYLPMNPQDLIDFSEKNDLLPSYALEAFVAKKFIAEKFMGYPRGIVKGYMTYLISKLDGSDIRQKEVFEVYSNTHLLGSENLITRDYVNEKDITQEVSKIACVFDPAINKYPEIKELYKRVGEFLSNPPVGVINIDSYWKQVHELSKVNGVPFIKCGYFPSDVEKAKSDWTELKARITNAQKGVYQDFSNELYAFFKGYEASGDEVAKGTFAPLFNKGLVQ